MRQAGEWLIWIAGAVAIGYLALFAYARFTAREVAPGDPIPIFRKDGAPSYSSLQGYVARQGLTRV